MRQRLVGVMGSIAVTLTGAGAAQTPVRIEAGRVGSFKPGMTVAQARPLPAGLVLGKPVYSDHKGGMVPVMRGKTVALWFLAGKYDTGQPMTSASRFEQIWVHDPAFATSTGVRPGMLVKDAEKRIGPVKLVEAVEFNGFETATFAKAPAGLFFAVNRKGGEAGKYATPAGEHRKATAYHPDARIEFIGVRPVK